MRLTTRLYGNQRIILAISSSEVILQCDTEFNFDRYYYTQTHNYVCVIAYLPHSTNYDGYPFTSCLLLFESFVNPGIYMLTKGQCMLGFLKLFCQFAYVYTFHLGYLKLVVWCGKVSTPYDWLIKLHNFLIVDLVCITSRHGLSIDTHYRINHLMRVR